MNLQNTYKPGVKVLDVYPASGIWSHSVYNALRPSQHILMESRKEYSKWWEQYLPSIPVAHNFNLQHLDPFVWKSYIHLTDDTKLLDPGFQSRDHIHTDFLLTGYVTNEQLLMQWLACLANQNWVQRFGSVKMLLWVPSSSAMKIMAEPGTGLRAKCSLVRETFSETKVIALPDDKSISKFSKGIIERDDPILYNPADGSSKSIPLTLLEINPIDHKLDTYVWDYVVKQLMSARITPLSQSLGYLGPAATEFFEQHLQPDFLERKPKDLSSEDFEIIVEIFNIWPFKPNSLIDTLDDTREL